MENGPLTRKQVLIAYYAMQAWERGGRDPKGEPYAPSWFLTQAQGFYTGIGREDRKNALRLIRRWSCLVCNEPMEDDSEGDHMIPLAAGGRWGVVNFLPLCQPHNSSKGKKDLIAWWIAKAFPVEPLLPDALTLYCRNNWQSLAGPMLCATAPVYMMAFLDLLAARLPTDAHRIALRSTYTRNHYAL